MRRFSLVLLIALASPLAAQTGRHTITHEDVFLMKRVAGPVISPDGRWIVFSVSEPSYTEGEQVTDLWLVPTDGSTPPRRLTNTKGGESGVEWSPDSRRIAFSARREGDDASQIYLLDLGSGGEAQRVTNLATGASSPQWRPDGRALLFASMVYPGATSDSANRAAIAERKARKYNARVFDASPIRLWDHWLDDRRPHLFVQSLDPGAPARDLLAGSQLVQGTGRELGYFSVGQSSTGTPKPPTSVGHIVSTIVLWALLGAVVLAFLLAELRRRAKRNRSPGSRPPRGRPPSKGERGRRLDPWE